MTNYIVCLLAKCKCPRTVNGGRVCGGLKLARFLLLVVLSLLYFALLPSESTSKRSFKLPFCLPAEVLFCCSFDRPSDFLFPCHILIPSLFISVCLSVCLSLSLSLSLSLFLSLSLHSPSSFFQLFLITWLSCEDGRDKYISSRSAPLSGSALFEIYASSIIFLPLFPLLSLSVSFCLSNSLSLSLSLSLSHK